jgi:hypothetical protein
MEYKMSIGCTGLVGRMNQKAMPYCGFWFESSVQEARQVFEYLLSITESTCYVRMQCRSAGVKHQTLKYG